MGILFEHTVLAVSEELDRLLALADQIVDEDFEVFVVVEDVDAILVLGHDQTQMLVSVGQDVQHVRWRVFQILRAEARVGKRSEGEGERRE